MKPEFPGKEMSMLYLRRLRRKIEAFSLRLYIRLIEDAILRPGRRS